MNVWIRRTTKRVECRHCGKFIETGEYQVVCTYFMPLKNSERVWKKQMHFHAKDPYCWVERAVTELEMRPHVEHRGGVALEISDEVREKRNKALRRRASVMQRIAAEFDGQQRIPVITHLTEMLEQLKVEVEPLGGVPKSWK